MGKGDKKSRKGKITMGSYGVLRPKKSSNTKKVVAAVKKAEATKKVAAPKSVAADETAAADRR